MPDLLDAALHLAAHGCSVVPVAVDGSKRPAVDWKAYQRTPSTADQLKQWFGGLYDGLGVITGAASGHLEMLEVEGRAVALVAELARRMADAGATDLWNRVSVGWMERSPSGGLHWHYRIDPTTGTARGNTKLARRRNPDLPKSIDVLVETRGEGGFTVTAPSHGRSHPSGQPWTLLAGGVATVPTITADERDLLHAIATQLDQMPVDTGPAVHTPAGAQTTRGQAYDDVARPGDDYNTRTSWADILQPHGWTRTKTFGGGGYGWTRPDKHARDGISATTGTAADGVDRLFVFSSSTEFETERPYSKFGAYAVLEHAGDHAAAARALRKAGYGDPRPPAPKLTLVQPSTNLTVDADDLAENGLHATLHAPSGAQQATTGATVHQLRPDTATQTESDSEDAHAHRLIAGYGDLIGYVPARKAWITWNGARWVWEPPGGGQVREYAKNIARGLRDRDGVDKGQRRKALSAAGISGCLRQAETDPRIVVDMGALDADPFTLNTPAGLVDLRTGEISTPTPDTLCTKTTSVAPALEPDPIWQRFLDETFGGDRDLEGYVQRLVGITLLGTVREQLLAFLHGLGANGKSTLVEALMHALGVGETGYAIAAPAEMLMVRKHQEHPAELAQLSGARMVVCSELDEGQRFAEAKIKQLTGRDSINARFLYGQPFTYAPTHTLWLLGNHRPQARTGGLAFWRRVKLIEFLHVVPPDQRDPALGDRLNAAAGTVLAWAIAGAVDYLAGGIREPQAVEQATASYAADQDTVGRFVTDSCRRADSELIRVPRAQLRASYESWCRDVGEEPTSVRRFTEELRDRFNVAEAKSHGKRFYTRICLFELDDDDQEPHEPVMPPAPPQEPEQLTLEAPSTPPTSPTSTSADSDPWALPSRDSADDVWQP